MVSALQEPPSPARSLGGVGVLVAKAPCLQRDLQELVGDAKAQGKQGLCGSACHSSLRVTLPWPRGVTLGKLPELSVLPLIIYEMGRSFNPTFS